MNIYQLTFRRHREAVDEVVVTVLAANEAAAFEEAQERLDAGQYRVTEYDKVDEYSNFVFDHQYTDNLGQIGSEELKENMV